jgi:hypothetical protein
VMHEITDRISHLWSWLLIGGTRKMGRTESATSRISKKKYFYRFFLTKQINFWIFIFSSVMRCKFLALFLANSCREAISFGGINYDSLLE